MSTTEHDLDRSAVDALDDEVDQHDQAVIDDGVDELTEDGIETDVEPEVARDEPVAEPGDGGEIAVDGGAINEIEQDEAAVAVAEAGSEPYELPEIVLVSEELEAADAEVETARETAPEATLDATPGARSDVEPGDPDGVDAREGDDDYVAPEASPDVLEELRRADIDGPMVQPAPQDDPTNAKRRPKRSADYDPAPIPIPLRVPRILGRKPRVRKVTRVVRHVDPWSVFKIAAIANLVLYGIVMTAGVLLWNVAYSTGTISNVERFFESFGWSSFEFNGGEIYHAAWIAGLFGVLGLTGLAVLAATLFNLITDLVGGVRVTVLEEEVVEARSTPMRRFVVRRPEPEVPAVIHDASGTITREALPDDTAG